MSEKETYRQQIQAKMEAWNNEIDRLEARANRSEEYARQQYHEEVKKLRALQEEARRKLEELEGAADDAWEGLREDVDIATNAVERAVNIAGARLS